MPAGLQSIAVFLMAEAQEFQKEQIGMKVDRVLSKEPDNLDGWWSIDAQLSLQQLLDEPGCPPLMRRTLSGELSWQERNRRQIQRAMKSPKVAPRWSAALLA